MATTVAINEQYVENIKNAPKFGMKDKIGYMFGDLGFNSLQVLVNSYFMLFSLTHSHPLRSGILTLHHIDVCRASPCSHKRFLQPQEDSRA